MSEIRKLTKRKAQGCFRAGEPRPWRYMGGLKAAQDRYRKNHAEEIKERKKKAYHKNPEESAAKSLQWKKENPERWREISRAANQRQRIRLRAEMVLAYGGKCSCCGEDELLFLELDHINNNGAEDRKKGHGAGVKLYGRLKKEDWPKDNYQLLCSNCNHGKRRNGGICPHKK